MGLFMCDSSPNPFGLLIGRYSSTIGRNEFKIDKKLNQLIVLEKSLSSSRAKAISYKWNGFGFDNDEILFEIENLKDLKCQFMLSEYQFKSIK